jgi:hypothetical protein
MKRICDNCGKRRAYYLRYVFDRIRRKFSCKICADNKHTLCRQCRASQTQRLLQKIKFMEQPAKISTCKSCKREIIWLTNINTKKNSPIDYRPSVNGNILILEDEESYRIIKNDEVFHGELHTSHFATCPNASDFRRR